MISVVVPALNEAHGIVDLLQQLQPLRQRGGEVILVDGGSEDETVSVASPYVDRIVEGTRGRARQMNAGAAVAAGEQLWFLHADTLIPQDADQYVQQALDRSRWGRFDVCLSGAHWLLRVVEWMMNHRSCWRGIATGDQGIFMQRSLFEQVGGFPEIPLMEDIAISRVLRQQSKPACITDCPLITSSRRWEQGGILRTILLMWWLRFAYWVGVSPQRLASWYR